MGDVPPVTILHPPSAERLPSVVLAGDDQVAAGGFVPIMKPYPVEGDVSCEDPVGAGPSIQLRNGVEGFRDQYGCFSCCLIGTPALVCMLEDIHVPAGGDAAMLEVGVDDVGVADAQLKGGVFFPVVAEPAHIRQLGSIPAVAHEHPERPARINGGELCPVTDQQHLRSNVLGVGGDRIQCQGSGEGGFVDDDQLAGFEVPVAVSVFVEPLRRVLRGNPKIPSEDIRGCG